METFECSAGMECERGFAQSIELPQFIRIDFKKKEISGALETGLVKTTKIENIKPVADRLILHGVEEGMGWSIAIMEKTGFGKKKVENNVFRLRKRGEIENAAKGIYIKA